MDTATHVQDDWNQAIEFWNSLPGGAEHSLCLLSNPFNSAVYSPVSPAAKCYEATSASLIYNTFKTDVALSIPCARFGTAYTCEPKDLSINFHLLNTRSLVKHGTEVAGYISDRNVDVMFITESWLHETAAVTMNLAVPEGYNLLHVDRKLGIGGGVACIYKDALVMRVLPSDDLEGCEYMLLKLTIDHNTTLTCLLLYRPPNDMPLFNEHLTSLVSQYLKPKSKFVICGDFNFWAGNPADRVGVKILDSLDSLGFTQLINFPTNGHGNTLDWVLAHNVTLEVISITPCIWSDHYMIHFALPIDKLILKPKPKYTICPRRHTKKILLSSFQEILHKELGSFELVQDVDLLATQLRDALNLATNTLAPLKNKICKSHANNKAWFSEELLVARRAKRKAETTWRRDPSVSNHMAYKDMASHYKTLIMAAKAVHYEHRITEANNNSRELFLIVRELEGSPPAAAAPLPSKAWCQALQDAIFAKTEKHLAAIQSRCNSLPPLSTPPHSPDLSLPLFSFQQVTSAQVIEAIALMKSTAYGGDSFTADLIKDSVNYLAPIIARLINLSFQSAIVPTILKEAWIAPLLKKQGLNPEDPNNYRPITNVSFILKILDFIAHAQMRSFIETHNLLNPRQSGFRKGFGTETALLDLKSRLSNIIDKGSPALLLLLDLSAAFDLVDHSLLTSRLTQLFSFSANAANWVESFLDNRTAKVFLSNVSADPTPLVRGIPQGSCMSPTLYNLYTRPLFDVLDQVGVGYTNYADDTQIYLPLTGNYEEDLQKIQAIFFTIQRWMAWNGLALNCDKTEILILGTRQMVSSLPMEYNSFSIEGSLLQTAKNVKTLGVYLDDTLSMEAQIKKVKSTCAYLNKLLIQIRPYLSAKNLAQVAGAVVNSRIDYCNSLYSGINKGLIQTLQTTQNNAVRAVTGIARREHISAARKNLHWLPVASRVTHKICSLAHKCLHKTAPSYLNECINKYVPGRTLRSTGSFNIVAPRFRLATFGGRCFPVQASLHWNALPPDIKNTIDITQFKKKLKTHLFPAVT